MALAYEQVKYQTIVMICFSRILRFPISVIFCAELHFAYVSEILTAIIWKI